MPEQPILERLWNSAARPDLRIESRTSARCLVRLLGEPSDFTLHPSHFTLYWPDRKVVCVDYRTGHITN